MLSLLCDDVLAHVLHYVPPSDGTCVALVCRALRGAWLHRRTYVFDSRARLLWAFAHGYRLRQSHATYAKVARSGRVDVLQLLWPLPHPTFAWTLFETALTHDLCAVAQWVVRMTGHTPRQICKDVDVSAAMCGSMDVLRWLHARDEIRMDALDLYLLAEEEGHFEAFAFLAEHVPYRPLTVMDLAMHHDDALDYLTFLAARHPRHEWWSEDLVHRALLAHNVPLLVWCHDNGVVALERAALLPHVHHVPATDLLPPDPAAVAAAAAWVESLA